MMGGKYIMKREYESTENVTNEETDYKTFFASAGFLLSYEEGLSVIEKIGAQLEQGIQICD